MESEKKHKYLPVLITIFVMLLLTAGAVAGVWYYMDKQAEDNRAELQSQIDELRSNIDNDVSEETIETEVDETGTQETSDDLTEIKSVCIDGTENPIIDHITYLENSNGEYATCGVRSTDAPGHISTLKKISENWQIIYSGHDAPSEDVCMQYKIPEILGGTCGF